MTTTSNNTDLVKLLDEHTFIRNLDNANKLMLIQGIDLIQNGLQFIEWSEGVLSSNAYDSLTILRNIFDFFKEHIFETKNINHLAIDRASESIGNVCYGNTTEIQKALKGLRELNVKQQREEYEHEKQQLINLAKNQLKNEK